jgi:Zn-dependent peptidase ImmA (M78 family)
MSVAVARRLATKRFEDSGQGVPVDLARLLRRRGFVLSLERNWPDQLCARYRPRQRRIEVNAKHLEVRRRFSIAHELGHFFLGHEQIDVEHGIREIFGDEEESYQVAGDREKEANAFATELLMPKRWVTQHGDGLSTDELTEFIRINCDVSRAAAWYRIMELKLAGFSSAPRRRR